MAIVVEVVVVEAVVEVSIARPIILLLGWGSWKGDVHQLILRRSASLSPFSIQCRVYVRHKGRCRIRPIQMGGGGTPSLLYDIILCLQIIVAVKDDHMYDSTHVTDPVRIKHVSTNCNSKGGGYNQLSFPLCIMT